LVFASIILISPAGITAALLLHGHEVVLPEGTEIAARVGATTTLDSSSFDRAEGEGQARSTQPAVQSGQKVTLGVNMAPTDAMLWIDGKRQIESSTKLSIARGLHKVKAAKRGFKTWQQRVVIAGDPLTLTIALEPK
jgi:hypothetical protein